MDWITFWWREIVFSFTLSLCSRANNGGQQRLIPNGQPLYVASYLNINYLQILFQAGWTSWLFFHNHCTHFEFRGNAIAKETASRKLWGPCWLSSNALHMSVNVLSTCWWIFKLFIHEQSTYVQLVCNFEMKKGPYFKIERAFA